MLCRTRWCFALSSVLVCLCVGLLVCWSVQATMVGILILKLAYYQAGLVLLLMVLTYFAKSSLRGSFEPAALSLPLEIAKVHASS